MGAAPGLLLKPPLFAAVNGALLKLGAKPVNKGPLGSRL